MAEDKPDVSALQAEQLEVDALEKRTESLILELDRRVRPMVDGAKQLAAAPAMVRKELGLHPEYIAIGCGAAFGLALLYGLYPERRAVLVGALVAAAATGVTVAVVRRKRTDALAPS